jgi:hypothetical protein
MRPELSGYEPNELLSAPPRDVGAKIDLISIRNNLVCNFACYTPYNLHANGLVVQWIVRGFPKP